MNHGSDSLHTNCMQTYTCIETLICNLNVRFPHLPYFQCCEFIQPLSLCLSFLQEKHDAIHWFEMLTHLQHILCKENDMYLLLCESYKRVA